MSSDASDIDMLDGPGSLPVAAIVGDAVRTVAASTTLVDVARTLMENGIGAVGVTGTGPEVVGIVTERDLVRAVAAGTDVHAVTASEVAQTELVEVTDDATVDEVANLMLSKWIRHALVRSDPEGIVSARDLLATYAAAGDLDIDVG